MQPVYSAVADAVPEVRAAFIRRTYTHLGGAILAFAILGLVMLLGMVMNVGRHVDGKIRMQNAADAAAYSGTLTIARGMNTLAFSTHLLCDVFALTAFLREGRDGNGRNECPQAEQSQRLSAREGIARSGVFPTSRRNDEHGVEYGECGDAEPLSDGGQQRDLYGHEHHQFYTGQPDHRDA